MKIFNAYKNGFKEACRQKKISTIIYLITLVVALMAVIPFKVVITNNFSGRPIVNKLLGEFDFTVFMDLMNNHGDLIRPFFTIIFWMAALYFLFTIFFAGGVLRILNERSDAPTGKQFFGGCAKYFLPFLRLGFYILILQLIGAVILALMLGIVMATVGDSPESSIATVIVVWLILQLIAFWYLSIISDYAKIIIVKEDSKKVWKAIGTSFSFATSKIYFTYPLFILLILVPFIISILYLIVDSLLTMNSSLTILFMLIIQQGIVWFRFFAKIWLIAGEYEFFNNYYTARTQPLQTQEIIMDESL